MHPLYLIVHNVRSAHNVGSMLRTADGAGVERVFLCGCTPAPIDRFGRACPGIAKTALGAERIVPWEQCTDTESLLQHLKHEGVRVVALEQHDRSVPYTSLTPHTPIALVVGEEVHGIPEHILELCDAIIDIPMRGAKESLNVSVATGIALYRLREN